MNKFVTFLMSALLALSGLTGYAQIRNTESSAIFITKEKRGSLPIKWYAKAGVSLMNATASNYYCSDGAGYKIGYNIAGGFQWQLGKSDWYLGAHVGLGQKGAKYDFISK